jgi:hypothetical protein
MRLPAAVLALVLPLAAGAQAPDGTACDLRPSGAKANGWKAGYHNGRAMMECLGIRRAGGGGGLR